MKMKKKREKKNKKKRMGIAQWKSGEQKGSSKQ